MFLQIHTLTSYHATLLNRDDAGLAKRIPFGDSARLRVSSQCLKRHWREALHRELRLPAGIRSRQFFARVVLPELVAQGIDKELATRLTRMLIGKVIDGGADDTGLTLKQPVLFGRPEADFFVSLLSDCANEAKPETALAERLKVDKKNFKAMLRAAGHGELFAGVEGALFGRFVTSDILARSDAAVHVAHAFGVHPLDTEVDYFTVVDDLNLEEETGAAHANDMELGAGVFYGYVAVDIPLLVSNFSGCAPVGWRDEDPTDVCATLNALVRAIATVSPGAKLGATAPYAYSDFVLLESGRQQPRSLANAFLHALRPRGDVTQQAVAALASHLDAQQDMYGTTADHRTLATTRQWPSATLERRPLSDAIGESLRFIFGEKCSGLPHPAI